ncbi:MAG: TniQ family protein [Comamonas sp.]|uniref:TniQ family protein n=1 Tax=Comamonas sp. TaxID=34028 RepID=UPI002FC86AB6
MIVRPPLPDEPLAAFIGRMKRNNLCSTDNELFVNLAEYMFPKTARNTEINPVELLAKIYGMTPLFFVRQHTMLPLAKLVVWFDRDKEKAVDLTHQRYVNVALRKSQNLAYLCRDCVAEDMEFRGLAYWRRVHQLPGIDRCAKHGTALLGCSSRDVLRQNPLAFADTSNQIFDDQLDDMCDNPVVARYVQIAESLLAEISQPIHVEDISVHIREWARVQNLRVSLNGKRPLLSDKAIEMLPREWLKRHFPKSASKEYGRFSDWLDGTWFSRKTPRHSASYILAFTLMYESADDAINALANLKSAIVPRKALTHRKRGAWDSNDLVKVWMQNLGNTAAIAKELNLSKAYIHQRLVAAGLPCLSKKAGTAIKLAIQRYWQGESIFKACELSTANIEEVESFLRVATHRNFSEIWDVRKNPEKSSVGVLNSPKYD